MSNMPHIITRRHILLWMGGVTGALTLHACTQQSQTTPSPDASTADSSPAEPVKAVNGSSLWIGYTPLYIAIEKGFFKEGGLDLDHRVFSSTGEGNAALASGRIQSINNVTSETVALAAKDQDFRIVQVADTSSGGDGILARTSVKDIADFKGRQVAVEIGSVSHFFLLQVLQEAGLTGDDVKITNVTPDAAATAYTSGKVDIAVTYSPFLRQANDAQKDGRIIYDTTKMPTAIVDVYLFNTQFVKENPKAMEAFVRGIFKGQDFLKTNPDQALAIAGKTLQLKPEQVADELKGVGLTNLENNLKMMADPSSDIYLVSHMDSLGQFLKAQNQIPEAPSPERLKELIDPTFLQAVQANPA